MGTGQIMYFLLLCIFHLSINGIVSEGRILKGCHLPLLNCRNFGNISIAQIEIELISILLISIICMFMDGKFVPKDSNLLIIRSRAI